MHDRDLECSDRLGLTGDDVLSCLEPDLVVARLPWEDPHHKKTDAVAKRKKLVQMRELALQKYRELPKPVLLVCSAGIDRSAPVAAYIWWDCANQADRSHR